MAYIVMALGVLMSIIGLGAIATGYPIIEVERGWATVISGTVLLSGGLITAALGIVVQSLYALKVGAPQAPLAAAHADPAVATLPFAAVQPADHSSLTGVDLPTLAVAAPSAAAFADTALRRQDAPSPAFRPSYEPPAAAPADWSPETPASIDDLVTDRYEEDAQPSPAHDPVAHAPRVEAEPPPPPSDEVWLDQAFSAFDYEAAGGHPPAAEPAAEARTDHEPMAHQEVEAQSEPQWQAEPDAHALPEPEEPPAEHMESALAEGAPNQAEPHDELLHEAAAAHETSEAPATAPEAPPSNLAVIGRYDSDGTSYVMYSDGSIEAQSEAGVYRFSSMAELKAFIEG